MSSVNVTAGFGTVDNVARVAGPVVPNLARLSLGPEGLMESAGLTPPVADSGAHAPDPVRLALGPEGHMERAGLARPVVGPVACTPDPARLALGLSGLMERAAQACPEAAASPVADFAFGGKWLAARLQDGSCGRAFTFIGEHEVHGPLDMDAFELLRELVGMSAMEAFSLVRDANADVRKGLGRLADIVAVALLNAVSSGHGSREALAARGFVFIDDPVSALVHPTDRVCVVGAGAYLAELEACPAQVDVCDMRPAYDLMGLRVGERGIERHPSHIVFYDDPAQTADLLSQADVVFLTGSMLVNGSFFELMPACAHAREVMLFGPSAGAPFEALMELGVTCVTGTHVLDPEAFIDSVARRREGRPKPGEAVSPLCESYAVTFPRS